MIAELRKNKGWTQERLAEECGISVRTIQRLESGEEGSLETLRIIAEVLDVSVGDLFETMDSSTKEKEIEEFTLEQEEQVNRRKADETLFKMCKLLYFFLMIGAGAFIDSYFIGNLQLALEILWVVIFFMGFLVLRYIKLSWWNIRLDSKYPLTQSIVGKKKKKEQLFWWNDKVARPVLMIFWSVIIPLLFILKYALHLF